MGFQCKAEARLHSVWTNKMKKMQEMNQAVAFLPKIPQQIIRRDEAVADNGFRVKCGPVVFKLCEKANGKLNLYVVVDGWICLEKSERREASFQTIGFGTNVGYFRSKSDRLEHVYGVHYDCEKQEKQRFGHPVLHAQLNSMIELAGAVLDQFFRNSDIKVCDRVQPILRNVRTPTAQMDFFSVVTQLCADHLMAADSEDRGVAAAFDGVRSACDSLLGVAHQFTYLNQGKAPDCYRSSHWYGKR